MPRNILAALRLTRNADAVRATGLVQRLLRGLALPEARSQTNPEPDADRSLPKIVVGRATIPVKRSRSPGHFLPFSYSNAAGTRRYKLYIPTGYRGRPCPLIVMLHGCTQSADDFAQGTQMNALAEERTFLVAYPEQSAAANASKCWNWFKHSDQQRGSGEPSLVAGITAQIVSEYAIDLERVYVAGMSAGGAAAAVLAATYPDVYAALAVHSGLACGVAHDVPSAMAAMRNGSAGAPTGAMHRRREPVRKPIPTIVFHGDRDGTVHPHNGDRFARDLRAADYERRVETGRVHGGRSYAQTTYIDPNGRRVFEQWVIHGSGHAWSGGSAAGSYTDPKGPSASEEIVRFFLEHRHSH